MPNHTVVSAWRIWGMVAPTKVQWQHQEQMPAEVFAHHYVIEKAIGLWGKMSGQANSSTRMEIAGPIVARLRVLPLRIATDSKSMIDKAMKLKEVAKARLEDPQAAWWPQKDPAGKPWGLQAD